MISLKLFRIISSVALHEVALKSSEEQIQLGQNPVVQWSLRLVVEAWDWTLQSYQALVAFQEEVVERKDYSRFSQLQVIFRDISLGSQKKNETVFTFKCGGGSIDQMLCLFLHPLLIVEFYIIFMLSSRAMRLSHGRRVVRQKSVTVVTIIFRHGSI